MLKIIVVEDEKVCLDSIMSFLLKYKEEKRLSMSIESFPCGKDFLSSYKKDKADVIFMDIMMPGQTGLEVAKELRRIDTAVTLVFVTYMAQYAITGYEVQALDFLIKPLEYSSFSLKLDRILSLIRNKIDKKYQIISTQGEKIKLSLNDIQYVESDKHYLIFKTNNEEYKVRGMLKDLIEEYISSGFGLANSFCLVNYRAITRLDKNTVYIGSQGIGISRSKKKTFINGLTKHYGETVS